MVRKGGRRKGEEKVVLSSLDFLRCNFEIIKSPQDKWPSEIFRTKNVPKALKTPSKRKNFFPAGEHDPGLVGKISPLAWDLNQDLTSLKNYYQGLLKLLY